MKEIPKHWLRLARYILKQLQESGIYQGCEDTRRSSGPSQCKVGEQKRTGPEGALNLSPAKPTRKQHNLNKLYDGRGLQNQCLSDVGRNRVLKLFQYSSFF